MKKKILSLVLVFALALALGIGGTVAWLTAKTEEVVNTFTVGDIKIKLEEHKLNEDGKTLGSEVTQTNKYNRVVPGSKYAKDPYVTITEGSENCWVFIKVTEAGGAVTVKENGADVDKTFDDFLDYDISSVWTAVPVPGHAGYYYYKDGDTTVAPVGKPIYILAGEGNDALKNGFVSVLNTVTKEMSNALTENNLPTLSFIAAAVQSENVATVTDAWNALPKEFTGTEPTNP